VATILYSCRKGGNILDTVIKTHNMTKNYDQHFSLKDINLTVKRGEIYGLIGKNGAGKTTILKILGGIIPVSSGKLELNGKFTDKDLNKERQRIGCIIETPSFFPYFSATKNLEYYRLQRGIIGKKCIDEVLCMVGLGATGSKKFKDFSLGMKQRLGLALALLGSPDILILDEPINGLDPVGIAEFREILMRLNKERNITMIISSHILSELSKIATVYGFIDKGILLEENSARDIAESCRQYILVAVDDIAKAVVILEKELRCNDYTILNDNRIKIYQYIDCSNIPIQALVNSGVKVYASNLEGISLEDYFISRIGSEVND
jgi:ABC-2 type transport system ATP-binding protein